MNAHDAVERARERLQTGAPILVTRLRHIGDVILSLPLLEALRRAYRHAPIDYLADPPALEALRAHPAVRDRLPTPQGLGATLRCVAQLRTRRYALAIDLYSNPRSAGLVRASGATLRIGEARRVRRHCYQVARTLRPGRNALLQHASALEILTGATPETSAPRVHLTPTELRVGAALLQRFVRGRSALLHLGATHPAKEWPIDACVALVRRLRDAGFGVVLSMPPERDVVPRAVAAQCADAAQALPVLGLRELFGVIAAVDGVVAVDGGIAHASVALQRPTLALFGPTDPRIWFPYTGFGRYRVLHAGIDCSSCDRERCPERTCMRALRPQDVATTFLELLEVDACTQRDAPT